jgi:centromere protein C
MDFLKGANGHRASFLPPPAARSPIKSGLTGSPRRTPALQSTPDPQDLSESSSPSDGKGSAVVREESRQDASPLSTRSMNVGRSNQRNGVRQNPTKKAQLASESEPAVLHDFSDFSDGDGDENSFAAVQPDFGNNLEVHSDSVAAEEPPHSPELDRPDHDDNSSTADSTSREAEPVVSKSTIQSVRKIPKANNSQAKPSAPRGRPKSQRRTMEDDVDPRPTKKRNIAKVAPPVRQPLEPELDRVVENYANRTGPLKGRSLYILKREIPTDSSATHTRSGRVSVRPLAYWRNERCVFGDGEAAEGHRYPLSTIKEVIRTEEQEPEKKTKKGKRSASHKTKSKKQKDESSDEDEDVDLWEKEGGVLHGYTLKWDGKTQTSSKEEEVLGMISPMIPCYGPLTQTFCFFTQISHMPPLESRLGRSKTQRSDLRSC